MIKGNVIKFGYGDVVVGGCNLGYIEITNIKPPLECGQTITKDIYKDLEIGLSVRIYEENTWDIYKLMRTVNENNRIVAYKGYVLDFSNYNEESVRVVKDASYRTVNLMCLAC